MTSCRLKILATAAVLAGAVAFAGPPVSAAPGDNPVDVREVFQLEGDAFDRTPTSGESLTAGEGPGEGAVPPVLQPPGDLDSEGNHEDQDDWAKFHVDPAGQVNPPETPSSAVFGAPCTDGPPESCGHVAGPDDPADPPGDAGEPGDAASLDGHDGGNAIRHFFERDADRLKDKPGNDDIFTQGTSLNLDICDWRKTLGSTPPKNDIEDAFAAFYSVTNLNSNKEKGDELPRAETIFVAGANLLAPNGTAKVLYWLLKGDIFEVPLDLPASDPLAGGPGSFTGIDFRGRFLPSDFDATTDDDPCDGTIELHEFGDIAFATDYVTGGVEVVAKVFEWQEIGMTGFGELVEIFTATDANCQNAGGVPEVCATSNADFTEPDPKDAPRDTESPDTWTYQAAKKDEPPNGIGSLPLDNFGFPLNADDKPGTTFFEGGVNLTALLETVGCFQQFLAVTVSSASVTAAMKDEVAGFLPLCALTVEKTGDELSKVGDDVNYTITITNTGAFTLYKQSIVDDLLGDLTDGTDDNIDTTNCGDSLAPGDSCTITLTYTVLQGDPDPLENTVTVTYNSDPGLAGDEVTRTDDHSVNLFQPSYTLTKTCTSGTVRVREDVNFQYVITNTSSNDSPNLDKVSVADVPLGDIAASFPEAMAPGFTDTIDLSFTTITVGTIGGTVTARYDVASPFNNQLSVGPVNSTADCTVIARDATIFTQILNEAGTVIVDPNVTLPVSNPVKVGDKVKDKATVTGDGNAFGIFPTGTVTFNRYSTADCMGTPTVEGPVALTGTGNVKVALTALFTTQNDTDLSWNASYASGDTNYNDAGPSLCEPLIVNLRVATIFTQILDDETPPNVIVDPNVTPPVVGSILVGDTVQDKATVTGDGSGISVDTNATVTFRKYPTGDCMGTPTTEDIDLLGGGDVAMALATTFTPLNDTDVSWDAIYNGNFAYAPAGPSLCEPLVVAKPELAGFVLIDEDGIDNGIPKYWAAGVTPRPNNGFEFTDLDVNDDKPALYQRDVLRFFAANPDLVIQLPTGQIGDEGWFAPGQVPGGLEAFFHGTPSFPPQNVLGEVPNVTPLRATGLVGLIGRNLCALVYDSDINVNFFAVEPRLLGNLQGETLGIVAFKVLEVNKLNGFSTSSLPTVTIQILDAEPTCAMLEAVVAPRPPTSMEPFDINPKNLVDPKEYIP